jgi:23S rRNA-/tRNA-specific pseudouridylate synthase
VNAATPTRFRVVSVEDGMMLRQLLSKRLAVPPAVAAEIVRAGGVYVGPVRMCVPSLRVSEGERVTVYRAAAEVQPLRPEDLRVVWRDESCVIVDKPHGVPAAATKAASRGTLAHALVQRLEREGVLRPYVGLVHPLAAAAAGLCLFTVRGQATESVFPAFAATAVARTARVRLAGKLAAAVTECAAPLARTPSGAWRLARPGERAPVAHTTRFTRVAELGDETLADVPLGRADGETLRLHAAALGAPLVGDEDGSAALCLCIESLVFTHPRTGAEVAAAAELPRWADPGA